jgi:hypothetical protein
LALGGVYLISQPLPWNIKWSKWKADVLPVAQ